MQDHLLYFCPPIPILCGDLTRLSNSFNRHYGNHLKRKIFQSLSDSVSVGQSIFKTVLLRHNHKVADKTIGKSQLYFFKE